MAPHARITPNRLANGSDLPRRGHQERPDCRVRYSTFATEVGLLVVVRLALTCRKQPQMAPSSSYIGLAAALQRYGR
jgi:hypothetical protein